MLCPGKSASCHDSTAATTRQAAPQNGGPLGSGPSGSRTPIQAPNHRHGVCGCLRPCVETPLAPQHHSGGGCSETTVLFLSGGEQLCGRSTAGQCAGAGLPQVGPGQGRRKAPRWLGWRAPQSTEHGPLIPYGGEAGAQGRSRGHRSHGENEMEASGLLLFYFTHVTKCKEQGGQHASQTPLGPSKWQHPDPLLVSVWQ